MMHTSRRLIPVCIATLLLTLESVPAQSQDRLSLAVGQRGTWDTSVAEIGLRGGIFKRHGLDLDILYTQGGGETQQAVIAGGVNVGIAAGVMGVLGAYAKGAPLRIIGAEQTGVPDMYFYVASSSPIKSLGDTAGKTIAYSTNGSSTHGVVNALVKQYGLSAKPTATGSQVATLTQVMSGQIDVGWSSPPFGLRQMDEGQIRKIAGGGDAEAFRGQTARLLITNLATLNDRKDALARFMAAYRESIDFMYQGDDAIKIFAEFAGIPIAIAQRTRDEFFPKAVLDPDSIVGLDTIMRDAVTNKALASPLTADQVADLVRLQPN